MDLPQDDDMKRKCDRVEELSLLIETGHDYKFVGRVGLFCPIKPGCGGALLMREKDGKYYAATGSKGYRWLEAEMVEEHKKFDDIDRTYYNELVDEAIKSISRYGDVEWFVSDDPYIYDTNRNKGKSCNRDVYADCPYWNGMDAEVECKLGYDCLPF